MDKNMFIQGLGSQTTKKPPKARLFNGKWCRYYIAGCIWISSDGTVAGMSDKKGHIKKLTVSSDSNGLYVVHDWYGKVYIDEAVITCYCPPRPKDGKKYSICHKDGNPKNCDKSNLEWVPYHYRHAGSDTVAQVLNGIKYKVCSDGTIKRGKNLEMFYDNLYDSDMDLEGCIEPYLSVPMKGSWRTDRIQVDDIMRDAGFVQGDDAGLHEPVILHRDYDWKNFASVNLEWTEKSDPRYTAYQEQKKKDMNQRCIELNPGKRVPDFWLKP